jgi:cytochrome c oxidase subunit 1
MLILGWEGMPRRYYDYPPQFQTLHLISTIGSWILIAGLIWIFLNLIHGYRKGEKARGNPWGASTLEWQTSSPPPAENFEKIPVVERGPYEFTPSG